LDQRHDELNPAAKLHAKASKRIRNEASKDQCSASRLFAGRRNLTAVVSWTYACHLLISYSDFCASCKSTRHRHSKHYPAIDFALDSYPTHSNSRTSWYDANPSAHVAHAIDVPTIAPKLPFMAKRLRMNNEFLFLLCIGLIIFSDAHFPFLGSLVELPSLCPSTKPSLLLAATSCCSSRTTSETRLRLLDLFCCSTASVRRVIPDARQGQLTVTCDCIKAERIRAWFENHTQHTKQTKLFTPAVRCVQRKVGRTRLDATFENAVHQTEARSPLGSSRFSQSCPSRRWHYSQSSFQRVCCDRMCHGAVPGHQRQSRE
jgi:hypothetical protein